MKVKSLSRVRLFATPWTVAYQAPLCTWDFPGNSTGMDCHCLLQGIFPTQGSNLGLPHCRQMLYRLSHLERNIIPFIISESVFYFYSDGKEYACKAGDLDSVPGLGRSPGEGNGNPLKYSCLENSMDRGIK